jgi:mono/diheme cytochrome c family protein
MKPARNALLLIFMIGAVYLYSCSKKNEQKEAEHASGQHGMEADWKFTLPSGNPGEGRKLFVELECHKCHEVKGEQFPGVAEGEQAMGPELSQMAGMHPVEFFAESIINPNAVIDPEDKQLGYVGKDGKSKMPDYNDILTVKQVANLAAYLASLKTGEPSDH